MTDRALVHQTMMLKKTIDTMVLAADLLKDCPQANELAQQLVAKEPVHVQEAVMRTADLLNHGCIKQMFITSPSASAAAPQMPTKKKAIDTLPMTYEEFIRFASHPTTLTKAEFVVPPVLYNGSSYRSQVERKDEDAVKWGMYKDSKMKHLKSLGFSFDEKEDKEQFLKKAEYLSSYRKRTALWAKFKITCMLLMGMKIHERAAPQRQKSASSSSLNHSNDEVDSSEEDEALEASEDEVEADDKTTKKRPMVKETEHGETSEEEDKKTKKAKYDAKDNNKKKAKTLSDESKAAFEDLLKDDTKNEEEEEEEPVEKKKKSENKKKKASKKAATNNDLDEDDELRAAFNDDLDD